MPVNGKGEYITWRQVFFGNKTSTYAFWALIVVMLGLTAKDLISTVAEYLEYEKSVDMVVRFNNSMAMPNITLCMPQSQAQLFMDWSPLKNLSSNEERRSYWDGKIKDAMSKIGDKDDLLSDQKKWPKEFLYDVMDVLNTLYMRENTMTTIGTIRQMLSIGFNPADAAKKTKIKKYLDYFKEKDVKLEEVRQKAGTEVLKYQCSSKRYPWTSRYVRYNKVVEVHGLYHDEHFRTDHGGTFFTMTAVFNMNNLLIDNLDCLTADVAGRPSTFWRFHLDHGRENNGVLEDLCFGDRHDVTTTVKAYYRMLEDDDVEGGTACKSYEPGEEVECHAKCRKQLVQENLDCTPITLEYLAEDDELTRFPRCDYEKLKLIKLDNATDTETDCRAQCYRDCNYIKYEVSKGVARHTSAIIAQTRAKSDGSDMAAVVRELGQDVPHNELTVNFLFTSFEYMDCEQDWSESWVEFVGNVGGVLGLWLGLSALSFVQAITFIYAQCRPHAKQEQLENQDEVSSIGRKLSGNPFGDVTLSQNPFGNDDHDLKQRRRKASMNSMAST